MQDRIMMNLGFLVLDAMRLVDDEISPAELLQRGSLAQHHLVGRDEHFPLARHDHIANQRVLQGSPQSGENTVRNEPAIPRRRSGTPC